LGPSSSLIVTTRAPQSAQPTIMSHRFGSEPL